MTDAPGELLTDSNLRLSNIVGIDEEGDSKFMSGLDVRIVPPVMYFIDAFEGKKYSQKLTIINCGSKSVLIRIERPTSSAFTIKTISRKRWLPPGLKIVRFVKYIYLRGSSMPFSWIPIFINEYSIRYNLEVRLSDVMISAVPQQIDFGTIDVGYSAAVRTFSLNNEGSKGTRFAIDLGKDEIELIVEPNKGIIQPNETLNFRVECLGIKVGQFAKEFWIKCDTPTKIDVKVNVIAPKLVSYHPNATENFTFVDFPRTYFGCGVTKTLVIKNVSSTAAVYCILADLYDKTLDIKEATDYDRNYLDFKIHPIEDYLQSFKAQIITLTYRPNRKIKIPTKDIGIEHPSFGCFRVSRVSCQTIDEDTLTIKELTQPTNEEDRLSIQTIKDETISLLSETPIVDEDFLPHELISNDMSPQNISFSSEGFVDILLYGEAETPQVYLRPDFFEIVIPFNTIEKRELLIENKSSILPIIFKYVKTCYIKVEPTTAFLKPSEKMELSVSVLAVKYGDVYKKITFDLMYYDRPKESNDQIKVGQVSTLLHFHIPASKSNEIIVNVPDFVTDVCTKFSGVNNASKSEIRCRKLKKSKKRLEKTKEIQVFCPDIKYQLSPSECNFKKLNESYYQNYIRNEYAQRMKKKLMLSKSFADYEVSCKKHLMLTKPVFLECSAIKKKEEPLKMTINLPLSPLQLNNIKIEPLLMSLGKVAPLTHLKKSIKIENFNEFPIKVQTYPCKRLVTFDSEKEIVILENEEVEISFTCSTPSSSGFYNTIIVIIVNSSHSFTISITGEVMPKRVKFPSNNIIFELDKTFEQYTSVYNILNVPVQCSWVFTESCFSFYPICSKIPPYCHIMTQITYSPRYNIPSSVQATLRSENGQCQYINVSTNIQPAKVTFNVREIRCKNLPLNFLTEKKIVIQNLEAYPVTFTVVNPEPIKGILINPKYGTISGYGEEILIIQLKFKTCVKFKCAVEVETPAVKIVKFTIQGNVCFPEVIFRPEFLKLRKIVTDSFEKQQFNVTNLSNALASVEFDLDDYPEFFVTATNQITDKCKFLRKVYLDPKAQKKLYLWFVPMGPAAYRFCFPTIINGLLGPSNLTNKDSFKPGNFIKDELQEYLQLSSISAVDLPKKLSVLQIAICVGLDMLRFSKLNFYFSYLPSSDYTSITSSELKIWNSSSKHVFKFCLRTDEINGTFEIVYVSGKEIEILDYSIVCTLASNEEVNFKINFNPTKIGEYSIKIPIYVRNYLNLRMFNCLYMYGIYPRPTISSSEDEVYFIPVPLGFETKRNIELTLEYHNENCKISFKCKVENLVVTFNQQPFLIKGSLKKKIPVQLKYTFNSSDGFSCCLKFYCTCECEFALIIHGCAENCILTNHAYSEAFLKWKNSFKPSLLYKEDDDEIDTRLLEVYSENTDTTSTACESSRLFNANVYIEDNTFPFFPKSHSNTDFAIHMRNVASALEGWLFHQGFYCKLHCKIPDGIALVQCAHNGNVRISGIRYVHLLYNLVGPQISEYIPFENIPEEELMRANFIYSVYSVAKTFVENNGGFLYYVQPEYLLEYSDYKIMKRNERYNSDIYTQANVHILDRYNFYMKSKQTWIDLLLQTYKVFVLARVRCPPESLVENECFSITENASEKQQDFETQNNFLKYQQYLTHFRSFDDANFWQEFKLFECEFNNIYNESETILLFWLEYHYNKNKNVLCQDNKFSTKNYSLPKKTIRFFEFDLQDSLALIVVTCTFCPYVVSLFNDIYRRPTSSEQLFHNTCKLVQCWKTLKLSFNISPKQILWPNAVQMIMLISYLYEVLPGLYPVNLLTYEGGLGTTLSNTVPIENINSFQLNYQSIFFYNELSLFNVVGGSEIIILPNQTLKIKVTFNVRFTRHVEAVLILNGEVPNNSYSKSVVFYLLGIPNLTCVNDSMTVTSEVYHIVRSTLKIKSPYNEDAEYKIFYTVEEPTDVKTLVLFSMQKDVENKIPKRLIVSHYVLECDEDGSGNIDVMVNFMTLAPRPFWLIFKNEKVGDFIILINTIPYINPETFFSVEVILPKSVTEDVNVGNTYKYVSVTIPSNNIFMGNALKKMILTIFDKNSIPLWKKYLGKSEGCFLVRWFFQKLKNNLIDVLKTTVTYKITTKGLSDEVHLPETTTINNTNLHSKHTIPLSYKAFCDLPANFLMYLQSENGLEYRSYQVTLLKE